MSLLDAAPEASGLDAAAPRPRLVSWLVLAAALVAWWVGARATATEHLGPFGLIGVLPVLWWVAAAAVIAGFVASLRPPRSTALVLAHLVGLVLVLYGTPALAEPFARVPTGYVHVGLVEHVVREGGVLHGYDARFSWPGGLGLGAILTELAGVGSPAAFLKWTPVVVTLLDCLPLWVIAARMGLGARRRWLALGLFVGLNWVGQDYWAPQALGFLLFLSLLAAVVHWWPLASLRGPRTRAVLLLGVVLVLAAVAVSHQLTPFAAIVALGGIALVGRKRLGLLPVVAVLLPAGWISWGAVEYWQGNRAYLTGDLGRPTSVVQRGVTDRVGNGASVHQLVLLGRVGLALAVWGGAALAWWAARRRGHTGWLGVGLAAAPFALVALQSYGGELPLRVYLFSLPFCAVLLASGAGAREPSRARSVRLAVAGCAVLPLVLVCRYGNESFEAVQRVDIDAVGVVYDVVGDDTFVLTANPFSPFRSERIGEVRGATVPAIARPDLYDPAEIVAATGRPDVLVLVTSGQAAYGDLVLGSPDGWEAAVRDRLVDAGGELLYASGDAFVVRIRQAVVS